MATDEITNSEDVIDSRDIISRLKELEDEREALADELAEAETAKDAADNQAPDADYELAETRDEKQSALEDWDADHGDELKALKALDENGGGEWAHGVTLIRDSHWEEYCRELVKDIGDLPKGLPAYIEANINWAGVADDLQADYSSVEFDGVTYWYRS